MLLDNVAPPMIPGKVEKTEKQRKIETYFYFLAAIGFSVIVRLTIVPWTFSFQRAVTIRRRATRLGMVFLGGGESAWKEYP